MPSSVYFTRASKLDFNQPGVKSGPWEISPADLAAASVPDGQYMQVLVDFISLDKISTPRLKSLTAIYSCEGGIN